MRASSIHVFSTTSGILLAWFAALAFSASHAQEAEAGPVAKAKERAADEFHLGMEVLRGMYRKRMAALISQATRVEVLLLDFSMGKEDRTKPSLGMFGIEDFKNTPILASHLCTPKELKELIPVLSNAVGGQPHQGGAGCHYPIHGLRVWVGTELAFDTSICWYCGNFMMDYGRGVGCENHTDGFRELKPILMRLMPIPEDEITRFKKDHDAGPAGH